MIDVFHDKKRELLIYKNHHGAPLHVLPDARSNRDIFAVPRTLRNCQILRFYGYPVPPIITDENYDFPIQPGRKPLAHQKVMTNFQVLHPRCFNLSDMGSMKTAATLWAADFLMRQYPEGQFRALIVAPLSILERVWANEIFKNFLNRRKVQILYGDASARRKGLANEADFYIVNFDGVGIGAHTRKRFELDGFSRELAERKDIRLVIIDEASAYKDAQTKRHRLARLIIGKRDYLWMLTGTPTPNAPTDAYGLAKLMNNAYGKSFSTFRAETMYNVGAFNGRPSFKWLPMKDGYEKARQLLQPSIRFDIHDVWDGPEMTTQQREIPLTAEQKRMMLELKKDLTVLVKSGRPITAANEAAARQKFLQISLGAIYDENHKTHVIDAHPRIDELKAVLDEAPAKVLVFAGFTNMLTLLKKELKKYSCEVVNGTVSPRERQRIFQAFQEDDSPRILLADPGTMAHGLDLWRAQTVVWMGPTDKTELYLQANKRAHRPGQKYPVTVVQFVSNKLEQEIYRRLETNTSMQGLLLDMVRKDII